MNERIQELIKECEITSTSYFHGRGNITDTYFDREKFAKLIIRECLSLAQSHRSQVDDFAAGIDYVRDEIKEHFGVEE